MFFFPPVLHFAYDFISHKTSFLPKYLNVWYLTRHFTQVNVVSWFWTDTTCASVKINKKRVACLCCQQKAARSVLPCWKRRQTNLSPISGNRSRFRTDIKQRKAINIFQLALLRSLIGMIYRNFTNNTIFSRLYDPPPPSVAYRLILPHREY